MLHEWQWQDVIYYGAALAVGLLGVARMLRILTNDDFPPAIWFRNFWRRITDHGPWSSVVDCLWCAAPYLVAVDLAWALLSDLHWSWWLLNTWMAFSYVSSWLVLHDEDPLGSRVEE